MRQILSWRSIAPLLCKCEKSSEEIDWKLLEADNNLFTLLQTAGSGNDNNTCRRDVAHLNLQDTGIDGKSNSNIGVPS